MHVSSLVGANVNLKIPMRLSDEKKEQRVNSFARLMQALHKVENLQIDVPTPAVRRTTFSVALFLSTMLLAIIIGDHFLLLVSSDCVCFSFFA